MGEKIDRSTYDKGTRRKIRAAIRKLAKEGLKYTEMVKPLSEQGFISPNGGPLRADTVQSQAHQSGIRRHKRKKKRSYTRTAAVSAAQPEMAQTAFDDSTILADLILDAKISDAKKISLLKNLRKQG